MECDLYDITFIGSGLSCTYTLVHYINLLMLLPFKEKVKILIIEKTEEFWTGIPYGNRSGYNSLIITPLKDFIPVAEREIFTKWLQQNLTWVFTDFKAKGGTLAEEWLNNNKTLIAANSWDDIYIPRYIFGYFLKEKITYLLKQAVNKNLMEYKLLSADVADIEHTDHSYTIKATTNLQKNIRISSNKIILTIGSPPKNLLSQSAYTNLKEVCYVEDTYHPHLNENITRVYTFLKQSKVKAHNNVLIIGSNASALEVFYNLKKFRELNNLINTFYILSPDGKFPHRIHAKKRSSDYLPAYSIALKNSKSFTAKHILEAVKQDIADARSKGIPIAEIIDTISHAIIELLNKLSRYQQKQFVCKYGVEIGKLQRRAGGEYMDAIEHLISRNKVEFIQGRFIPQSFDKKSFSFAYKEHASGQKKVFSTPLKAIINCSGSQNLPESSSSLIRSLIKRRICISNDSNRGFAVNEKFEATKNFYIMGPLLAGNVNSKLRVWHAESCTRIFSLSRQLAEVLVNN